MSIITRKRKNDTLDYDNLKKKIKINWYDMISATKVRNYMLDDPLLDWLSFYKIRNINDIPLIINQNEKKINNFKIKSESGFTKFIMDQGNIFEREVVNILKRKHQLIQVAEPFQARDYNKYLKTIEFMKNGIEIIYQGVLIDTENNLYGCPDLLVRSDRINDIFKTNLSMDEVNQYSKVLDSNYFYIVVEIKHSTLYLSSNNVNLINCNSIPAYKGQLYIYNKILSKTQSINFGKTFVLGKKWILNKKNQTSSGNNFLEKLGQVDFDGYDNHIIEKVSKAINWIKDMRTNGHNWRLLPTPSKHELYPNMKNEKDGDWRKLKNDLTKSINEITSVWMCGVKKRNIALEKNIFSWTDTNCNSRNLNFKPSKTSTTLDYILDINRQNNDMIWTNSLCDNDQWKYFGDDTMEFFIDYETINSNMGQCEINNNTIGYNDKDIIFLIGIGYNDNGWKFKKFLSKTNTISGELDMIKEFWECINSLLIKFNKSESVFLHWTQAEPICYKKLQNRHEEKNLPNKNFYDMYLLFKNNNIVVKGALNFSLKSIAKAMYKNNLISSSWDNSICSNGLNAMLLAYEQYKNNNSISGLEPTMLEIIKYNEIDCKVLFEIMNYFRNNY